MTAAASELSVSVRERDVASSGESWGADLGGAAAASALSLVMLALGAGFGLSTVSPWSNVGISAASAGSLAIAWLVLTQVVAFSMGGYLTGRLRTKWHVLHDDEVHFRDTANGFLSWSVAVVLTVAFLGAAASTMAGTAVQVEGTTTRGENAYFVDRLFRSDRVVDNDSPVRAEAARIFGRIMLHEDATASDVAYLTQLVAVRTGLNAADAGKRVSDTIADTRRAEDGARKATAHLLLWIFLSLMIGAFCASFAATIGAR